MNVENSNTISEDINSTSTSNEYLNKKIFSSNDLVELLQPKQQPKDKDNSGALLFLFAGYSWFLLWLGTSSFCTPVVILKYLNVTSIS